MYFTINIILFTGQSFTSTTLDHDLPSSPLNPTSPPPDPPNPPSPPPPSPSPPLPTPSPPPTPLSTSSRSPSPSPSISSSDDDNDNVFTTVIDPDDNDDDFGIPLNRPRSRPMVNYEGDTENELDYELGWEWIEEDPGPMIAPYSGFRQSLLNPAKNKPEDFFEALFEDRMYTIMADETNRYAHKRRSSKYIYSLHIIYYFTIYKRKVNFYIIFMFSTKGKFYKFLEHLVQHYCILSCVTHSRSRHVLTSFLQMPFVYQGPS